MPPLVVVVAPEEADLVTLGELRELLAHERVLFESDGHPLALRLAELGAVTGLVTSARVDDERDAVVVAPGSPRGLELARSGATVTTGVAGLPDGLTAARGSGIARRAGASAARLAAIMARLRSPDGCPWDLEQTHRSLRTHLLEETYEVLDAIDRGEVGAKLEEELGDLLLQVFFHAQLARDEGTFDVAGVADRLVDKLVRRHPHVFGDVVVGGAEDVVRNWDSIKSGEVGASSDAAPVTLPALLAAAKAQRRAGDPSLDARTAAAELRAGLAALEDGASGSDGGAALGDVLFAAVALARAHGVDPEAALREKTAAFLDEHRRARGTVG